ncbi:MAG TPA: cupin domain-containing protein [Blastocatellia bacterium]|jgi:quercetin dioxygenase-like cupin family protein|nr:cupin domain-containing protein [Blastocatellia bacterium]
MSLFTKLKPHCGKSLIVGMACGMAGFAVGVFADETKRMAITPFQEARFVPIDPARPDGSQIALLWGDPAKGPAATLFKSKKGAGPLHFHTSDTHVAVVQGTVKHWAEGEQEADAKPLGAGSYWFQPGNQVHGDSCVSDECVIFVKWEGKIDGRPPETLKK